MNQDLTENTPQEIHGVNFFSRHMGALPTDKLESLADQMRQTLGSGVVAITAIDSGRVWLVVAVTSDFSGRIDVVPLLQAGVEALGGETGDDNARLAQGIMKSSGPNIDNAADALTAVGEAMAAMLDAAMRGEAEAIA